MRMTMRYLTSLIASAGAAAAIVGAPFAAADTNCDTAGQDGQATGTQTTVCQSPGNFQMTATAPDVPVYSYPWDDEFYGSAMIIGPNEPMHSYGGDGGPHR